MMTASYEAWESLRSRRYIASHHLAAAVLQGNRKQAWQHALEFQRLDDEALELGYQMDATTTPKGTQ